MSDKGCKFIFFFLNTQRGRSVFEEFSKFFFMIEAQVYNLFEQKFNGSRKVLQRAKIDSRTGLTFPELSEICRKEMFLTSKSTQPTKKKADP